MKTLYQLNLISNKKDEREECKSIINILESFDFLMLVRFFSSLFEIINPVSTALQHENNDLQKSITAAGNPEDRWDEHVKSIQCAINCSVTKSTGVSPLEALAGLKHRHMAESYILNEVQGNLGRVDIRALRQTISERISEDQKRQKEPTKYEEGQLLRINYAPPATGGSKKLLPTFKGAFRVIKALPNDRYELEDQREGRKKRRSVTPVDSMKTCIVLRVWGKTGYNNLQNLSRAIERHEKSQEHISSSIKFELFGKQNIANLLDTARERDIENFNEKVRENREILKRLIDAVVYLSKEECFRGHDETSESDNKGNFKELIDFLKTYDQKLERFLSEATVFVGSSKSIQNDLIESISSVVKHKIQEELRSTAFFSWQIDETTDIACKSQLSVIFCYVIGGFYDVSSGNNAESLYQLLVTEFQEFDLKHKLIAQTYDGAAVMSGDFNGLQSKIKNIAPHALFTHCYAHKLNLVLSKVCSGFKGVRIFFSNLSGFSSFFSKSSKRSEVLNRMVDRRIPTNAPTRWSFSSRAVVTIESQRRKLIEVFEFISESEDFFNDNQALREVYGLRQLLFFIDDTDAVSSTEEEAADNPQRKKRKTYFNFESKRLHYKQIFAQIFVTIIVQLETRFADFSVLQFFDLVNCDNFSTFSKEFPNSLLDILIEQYPIFDHISLKNELSVLYSDKDLLGGAKCAKDMLLFIFNNNLKFCLPELYKLLSLVLSIPVTSASVERSFSALKRIKTYNRSKMTQDRLSGLSLNAIEKHLVSELKETDNFYDNVIDYFDKLEKS
nr:unnamed protein product [Callosobruchus analis]